MTLHQFYMDNLSTLELPEWGWWAIVLVIVVLLLK